MIRIGILSDTHGYWQPKIPYFFSDVDLILHAGDIGSFEIIENLEKIAPVTAVRGNSDSALLAQNYAFQEIISIGNFQIFMTHQFNEFKASDRSRISELSDLKLVVCGHTHAYSLRKMGEIHILNPGSAGKSGRLDAAGVVLLMITGNDFWCERLLYH